jgi:hypothetical protein
MKRKMLKLVMLHAIPPSIPRLSMLVASMKYARHEGKPTPIEIPTSNATKYALIGKLLLMKSSDDEERVPISIQNKSNFLLERTSVAPKTTENPIAKK